MLCTAWTTFAPYFHIFSISTLKLVRNIHILLYYITTHYGFHLKKTLTPNLVISHTHREMNKYPKKYEELMTNNN